MEITEKIKESIGSGMFGCGIFIDLTLFLTGRNAPFRRFDKNSKFAQAEGLRFSDF